MKKLFALAALLASTFAAVPAPSAQAIATCGPSYCTGRPSSSTCACPAGTPYAGDTATCGSWFVLCYPIIDP
jgi:hypothetical protein